MATPCNKYGTVEETKQIMESIAQIALERAPFHEAAIEAANVAAEKLGLSNQAYLVNTYKGYEGLYMDRQGNIVFTISRFQNGNETAGAFNKPNSESYIRRKIAILKKSHDINDQRLADQIERIGLSKCKLVEIVLDKKVEETVNKAAEAKRRAAEKATQRDPFHELLGTDLPHNKPTVNIPNPMPSKSNAEVPTVNQVTAKEAQKQQAQAEKERKLAEEKEARRLEAEQRKQREAEAKRLEAEQRRQRDAEAKKKAQEKSQNRPKVEWTEQEKEWNRIFGKSDVALKQFFWGAGDASKLSKLHGGVGEMLASRIAARYLGMTGFSHFIPTGNGFDAVFVDKDNKIVILEAKFNDKGKWTRDKITDSLTGAKHNQMTIGAVNEVLHRMRTHISKDKNFKGDYQSDINFKGAYDISEQFADGNVRRVVVLMNDEALEADALFNEENTKFNEENDTSSSQTFASAFEIKSNGDFENLGKWTSDQLE